MLHEKENLIKSSCRWLLFRFFLLLCWQVPRSRSNLHTHSGIIDNIFQLSSSQIHLHSMGTRPGNCIHGCTCGPTFLSFSSFSYPFRSLTTVFSPFSSPSHTHSYIPCCLLCRLWLVSCCLGRAILLQDVWGKEHIQAVHGDLPELLLKLLISAPKECIYHMTGR